MVKGYYNESEFRGYVDGEYMQFPTDEEYYEFIKEKEDND